MRIAVEFESAPGSSAMSIAVLVGGTENIEDVVLVRFS
jgi:hypothetical protein